MAKIRKANKKIKILKYIFLSLILMSIGYASLNSIAMDIKGDINAKSQDGVFITEIQLVEDKTFNASNSDYSINKTLFKDSITLSDYIEDSSTTSITYKVTIYNSNDFAVKFEGAKYDSEDNSLFYTNQNISFNLKDENYENEYVIGEIIPNKSYANLYITFQYKDGKLPSNVDEENFNKLDFYINLKYEKVTYQISYFGDMVNIPNYPTIIGDNEDYDIELISDIAEVNITNDAGTKLDYEIYYDNASKKYRLVVNNIKSKLNVEIYYYIRVDYLKGDGTAFIDTGYIPNSNTTVELDFAVLRKPSLTTMLMGSRNYDKKDFTNVFYAFSHVNGDSGRIDSYLVNSYISYYFDVERYKLKMNKNAFYVNNELVGTDSSTSFQGEYPIYLFSINTGGIDEMSRNPSDGRKNFDGIIYNFKVYDNSEKLVRDMVPVYKYSNNEPGMYDLVNSKFYINAQDLNKYSNSKFTYVNDLTNLVSRNLFTSVLSDSDKLPLNFGDFSIVNKKMNDQNYEVEYYGKNGQFQYKSDGSLILAEEYPIPELNISGVDLNNSFSIYTTINADTDQEGLPSLDYTSTIAAISQQPNEYLTWFGFYKNYFNIHTFYVGGPYTKDSEYNATGFSSFDISEYSNKKVNIQIVSTKSGMTKVYFNGELLNIFYSGENEVTNSKLTIGDLRPGRGLKFTGNMYDFAFYNSALTEEEVKQNWQYANEVWNIE